MLALQAACKQVRWAFIDFFYFLCHSPDNRTISCPQWLHFFLNKSGKNKATLSKQMSEETLTWGRWDEKYRWSAQAYWVHLWCAELVLCNFIPSMIWCGEGKKNIYCFIVIVNNSSRERERDQGNPHKRMTQKNPLPLHIHTLKESSNLSW